MGAETVRQDLFHVEAYRHPIDGPTDLALSTSPAYVLQGAMLDAQGNVPWALT